MADTVRCEVCDVRVKAENEAAHMRRVHPNVPIVDRQEPLSKPRDPFYLTARSKKALFAVLAAVVLVAASVMLLRSAERTTPIDASAIPVRVSMSGFSPSTLTVRMGEPLKIDLINLDNQYHTDGGGWHDFVLEAFGMNMTVEPLGQRVFTIPTDRPGSYPWYCDLCCGGKESPSMVGWLRVEG